MTMLKKLFDQHCSGHYHIYSLAHGFLENVLDVDIHTIHCVDDLLAQHTLTQGFIAIAAAQARLVSLFL